MAATMWESKADGLPLATPVAMKPNAKSRIAIVRREISAATRNQAMPQVYTHSPGVVSQSPSSLTRRRRPEASCQ
jgi:hypothetical protein